MNQPMETFQRQLAAAATAEQSWQALEHLAAHVPGHILFTVMTVDMAAGLARRAFSNHPKEYPVSGTKPIHRDSWFDIVHGEKRSFVANTLDDIAKVFPDYNLIGSLGCGSVMNLPVVAEGELVATINMLHQAGHYTPERVTAAEAALKVPALQAWQAAMRFDSAAPPPA